MKKILTILAFILALGTAADAMPTLSGSGHITNPTNYSASYNTGYRHGKNAAYHNVATTLVTLGAIIIAGIVIYDLGEQSRWTMGEHGVGYRF